MALSANSDIECYNCGKKYHNKNDCPKLQNQSGNNQGNGKGKGKKVLFEGNCSHFRKFGHRQADCWGKHPENKSVKYWKYNNVNNSNIEFSVIKIEGQ